MALLAVALLLALPFAARALVVNDPGPADTLLVLDGEYEARPELGLADLKNGLAPHAILDVDGTMVIYGVPMLALAEQWRAKLPPALAERVDFCVTNADSTAQEAERARACLGSARRVLLVTSDYHSRRALSIFRHVDPTRQYMVAAAHDPDEFGMEWWRHRNWAKQTYMEWSKLLWWELVQRWV